MAVAVRSLVPVSQEGSPGRVVGHDIVIEVPEDVGWRLWSVGDDTGEVDGGSSVDMKVWRSMNPHVRD